VLLAGCGGSRAAEWRAPNADLAGTRSADTTLDAGNASGLVRAWRFVLPEDTTFSGSVAATPLVLDGRVYLQTLRSNVYALDAQTGKVVWKRRFDRQSGGPNGLAAAGGRLYGSTDTDTFALDRDTGATLWQRRLTSARQPIDVAPAVADGLVFTSTTAPRPGGKGRIVALDERTGSVRWTFTSVRGDWPDPKVASGGGLWWTPTLADGVLYAGTSNPLPWGGTPSAPYGGAFAGRALYTDSLLALDAQTGKLRWYDQVTPPDVRDYDFALPPVLAGGLVVGAGKAGRVIAGDRKTHRRAWSTAVGLHRNDTGPLPSSPVEVCPGLLGGVLTPLAVADGRVFVPVVDLCMRGSATGYENFMSVDYARGRGELVALDLATGRPLWTRRLPSPNFGCATAANDTVVTATYDGRVLVLDAASGRTLWSTREPAGINSCPALAGDLLVVPAGAEPSTIATPTPVVDAFRVVSR
jgi:outer membrane protein assembly factor BamB